jgi:S-DNA-T family DNA segregation ATPase FtsK/SpoIIIE
MVKNTQEPNPLITKLTKRAIEGLFVFIVALAAYFFIAFLSYDASDAGWSSSGFSDTVNNSAGKAGALLADSFFSLLGYAAYILPLLLVFRAWVLFRDREYFEGIYWPDVVIASIGMIFVLISFTGLLSINTLPDDSVLPFGNGGMLGEFIGVEFLESFGLVGGRLVLFTLFFIGVTIFTDVSWMTFIEEVGRLVILKLPDWYEFVMNKLTDKNTPTQIKQMARELIEPTFGKDNDDESVGRESIEHRKIVLENERVKQQQRIPPKISLPDEQPPAPSKRIIKEKQPQLFEDKGEVLPAISLLTQVPMGTKKGYSTDTLEAMSRLLEHKLLDFKIEAVVTAVYPGPVITRFEIQPAAGVKVSTISNLAKDLARSLAVISVRVVEVIPGKSVIGIEIPNENREIVYLSQVLGTAEFDNSKSPLTLALGYDIAGKPVVADLGKMPHLLVAGTTGSGKSVGVNAMLMSLLFKSTPDEVRLILIDPKMLELSIYEGIPHLLTPVITDMKDAANGLRWCVAEMERRYKLMAKLGVRNIAGYNKKVIDAIAAGEPIVDPLWDPELEFVAGEATATAPDLRTLPYVVVVIDEFADMMMVVGKKVEELIARIAQKARAAGIHLILATQRPSVDVITGLIKANVPTRIGFQVSSKIDSRTILDQGGAEQLLGHGDMLYMPPGSNLLQRVHGAFVDDDEVHRVVAAWKLRGEPEYIEGLLEDGCNESIPGIASDSDNADSESDPLYDEALAFVTETRKASISSVQRKLRIGYNRAARMIESMEAAGVVSEMGTNGQREVLAPPPVGR